MLHPASRNTAGNNRITGSHPRILSLIIYRLFAYYFSQPLDLLRQTGQLQKHLFLVRLQVGVLTPELHVLLKDLAVLLTQQVDGRLKLGQHVVVTLAPAEQPGEDAADKTAGKGEH